MVGTEPRPPHLGVACGSRRCRAPSSRDPTLLCLHPSRVPALSRPSPTGRGVPSASLQVPTLLSSRSCPPLTHHGSCSCPGLRAPCSADGSSGATGRCPRGHWLRPRPRGRPGHPTSPEPRRAPAVLAAALRASRASPPPTPASCFPPALRASPGGVRTALPHLPGPRRGEAATRALAPGSPPPPLTLPRTMSATAACTHHKPDDRCSWPPGALNATSVSSTSHTRPAINRSHQLSGLWARTSSYPLQPAWYIHSAGSHIPAHNLWPSFRKYL